MPQTRPNGTVVPINSDEYNPTQDLADLADSIRVAMPVADKAARDALGTPYVGQQVIRLDRDGWIQTYTGTTTSSGWEYRASPRTVTANTASFTNASGTASRLLYTIPGLVKPYPQQYRARLRLGVAVNAIVSGNLWINVAVSGGVASVAQAQGKFGLAYFSPGNYLQSGYAETPWLTTGEGQDPLVRAWIEVIEGLVTHTASVLPAYSHFYVELRPLDD